MNALNHEQEQLEVRRGNNRVRSIWLAPTPSGQADHCVPPSAGQWIEKEPHTYARHQVTVPVIVGSTLRIF